MKLNNHRNLQIKYQINGFRIFFVDIKLTEMKKEKLNKDKKYKIIQH